MEYRKEIDGLRAIAVLAVVLFHGDFSWFSGGYVGVDVFFVISGYLITSVILNDLSAETFSLVKFFERRVRRIFPALFAMASLSFLVGWLVLLPIDMQRFSKSLMWLSGFVSNLLFAREEDYFDIFSDLKPLLHTWSISVEEQFYIVFPILILAVWKFRKSWLPLVFAAIALASFSYAARDHNFYQSKNFYLLLPRIWELMVGALLAKWDRTKLAAKLGSRNLEFLSFLGIIFVLFPIFYFSEERPISTYGLLLPTLGAGLIILCSSAISRVGKVLSGRFLVSIGLCSYSIYLWHQPFFIFARHISPVELNLFLNLGLAIASVIFGFFSWRFIEQPFRNSNRFSRLQIFAFLIGGSASIFGAGYVGEKFATEIVKKEIGYNWKKFVRQDECLLQNSDALLHASDCIRTGEAGKLSLLIWGDSHGASLYPGFNLLSQKLNFNLSQLTQSGCPPFAQLEVLKHRKNCNVINERILEKISQIKFDIIVLHAAWVHEDYPMSKKNFEKKLEAMVSQIKMAAPDSKLILISNVPRWHISAQHAWEKSEKTLTTDGRVYARANTLPEIDQFLRSLSKKYSTDFISPSEVLCEPGREKCTIALDVTGELIYSDYSHLTKRGSEYLAELIQDQIQAAFGSHAR